MKNQVILFQGDSITDCGRSREANVPNTGLGGGYPFMAAAHLLCAKAEDGLKFFNRGISGNRIVDLYARWKIDGLNLNPDVISILIGVNDTWHAFGSNNGVEVPRFEQFYRMLLDSPGPPRSETGTLRAFRLCLRRSRPGLGSGNQPAPGSRP